MEIKNKLTVTKGRRVTGERKGRVKSRNIYKGPMDKDNMGGRIECGRWGCVGQGRVMREK